MVMINSAFGQYGPVRARAIVMHVLDSDMMVCQSQQINDGARFIAALSITQGARPVMPNAREQARTGTSHEQLYTHKRQRQ
jgi:hypothetical protein